MPWASALVERVPHPQFNMCECWEASCIIAHCWTTWAASCQRLVMQKLERVHTWTVGHQRTEDLAHPSGCGPSCLDGARIWGLIKLFKLYP